VIRFGDSNPWVQTVRIASLTLGLAGNAGCARLHHYQLGDIDGSQGQLRSFEIQVDETGLDAQEGIRIAKATTTSARTKRELSTAEAVVSLTQVGHKTGDPTFSDDWADGMLAKILAQCPSGQVTGLVALRESADYPVVSGEIVTIRGYCIR
jgi:hypothetical protein